MGLAIAPSLARPSRKGWATKSVLRKHLFVRPGTSGKTGSFCPGLLELSAWCAGVYEETGIVEGRTK